jgi:hypothetical protein
MFTYNMRVITERGEKNIWDVHAGDMIDTPMGFRYVASKRIIDSQYCKHYRFSNNQIIAGNAMTFFDDNEMPLTSRLKEGQRIKTRSGFVFVEKGIVIKRHRNLVRIIPLSDGGRFYIGDILVA